jgi:hypothetical protein
MYPMFPYEGKSLSDEYGRIGIVLWSRCPESNRDLALRRRSFYPLNYSENRSVATTPLVLPEVCKRTAFAF